ncbi:MAG: PP2C family protein-serine/threonine phosphatase [Desulfobacterales bacterium]|nr:PP2C family protein-serine/threonine phosphatase [Desulfobacterales bacterium]
MTDNDIREMREDYGDFLKEVLNTAVGSSISELEQKIGKLTYISSRIIYGEIDFPDVLSGNVKIESEKGEILCGFCLNLAKLKIGRELEEAKAENIRMRTELDVARKLQQMVLPSPEELEQTGDLDIAAYMEPADEVGGDYYDILMSKGRITIGIGDVTGHGLESGVVMLMVQTAIRTLLIHGETDPIRFLDTVNRVIYDNVQRMQIDKMLTLALINYSDGVLKLCGQHEEMIVVRKDGRTELVNTIDCGMFIGLVDDIAEFIDERSVALDPGDGAVLYTDGITEARNPADELYGLKRFCDVVSRLWTGSAEKVMQKVVEDVREFIGGQQVYDDITLVVLKRQ